MRCCTVFSAARAQIFHEVALAAPQQQVERQHIELVALHRGDGMALQERLPRGGSGIRPSA